MTKTKRGEGERNSEMELETFKALKTLCKNAVIIYGEKKNLQK